jgi:hypothetical protein
LKVLRAQDIAVIVYKQSHQQMDIGKHMQTVKNDGGFVRHVPQKGYGKKQAL